MSLIDPTETLESETEEENEERATLDADATWAELELLEVDDLLAWAEKFPEAWDAHKRGRGYGSEPTEPEAAPSKEEQEQQEQALEDLSEAELLLLIDTTKDRIDDPLEAREVAELREGGGPSGSPSRLAALRAAAARAVQVAGPAEAITYPITGSTTYEDVNGDIVTVALDTFGRRVHEISRWSAEEVAEAQAVSTEEVIPAKVTLSDVADWTADRWTRFADEHPQDAERLRRAESAAMDAQQIDVRRSQGIF